MHLHNSEKFLPMNPYSPSSVEKTECRIPARPLPSFLGENCEQECILTRGGYSIRLADSHRLRREVSALVERMYSSRGYQTESVAISSYNPNRLTLEASTGREVVGTLTLGLDSEKGLLADELYREEINAFRMKGKKVCELSKLAVDTEHNSKEILASLFHLAYIYGRNIHRSTDLFIEVNPRHASFYGRMLGLRQIGDPRMCQRVNAPAVLMHLELAYVDDRILSLAGAPGCKEKSLYPYFFSQREEEGLAKSLRRHLN